MRVIVTGGAGFIGSAFVWKLNREKIRDIFIVDNLGTSEKWRNLVGLRYRDYLHKDAFLSRLEQTGADAVVHLGACSSTVEENADYLMENNYRYTKTLAEWAQARNIRFVYASSGATYGDGAQGFSDDDSVTPKLSPLNRYGYSKHFFDLQALESGLLESMAGVKFFNVFGPNEYHKGFMASVVYKSFFSARDTGKISLFASERPDFPDGGQRRDFIYVKDVVDTLWWLTTNADANGLFNLGTGEARTWNDLARAVFAALERPEKIEYIPLPDALKDKYQYHTQAQMQKLRAAGYAAPFTPLEDAITDYVQGYLLRGPAHLD